MKISEKNMFVKISRRYDLYYSTVYDICRLMRRVAMSLIITAVFTYMAIGIISFFVALYGGILTGEGLMPIKGYVCGVTAFNIFVGTVLVFSIVLCAIVTVFIYGFVHIYTAFTSTTKQNQNKKQTIIMSWLHAKKARMCSFIEIVPEENK